MASSALASVVGIEKRGKAMTGGATGGGAGCREDRKLEKCEWYDANTFHHGQFRDIERLLELKAAAGKTISVCLPS